MSGQPYVSFAFSPNKVSPIPLNRRLGWHPGAKSDVLEEK